MLVLLAAGPVSVIACSDSANTNDCSDGKDNDGDGKIDDADPGCVTDQRESADEGKAKCGNGVDDDGDSKVDFPDDPQCASKDDDTEDGATPAKCQDNRDNDGDGKLDFPDDPGCSAPNADDEMDDCPNGPLCPQCSNGKDDDGNGKSDYPNDSSGCTGASDNDEFTRNLAACGPMVNITPFPAANEVTGILQDGAASRLTSMACGGQGPEVVYELRITEPRVLTITTDFPETTANTVLYLRGTDCASDASEATCNNDISPSKVASTITASVTPGVYYLVIDNDDRVLGGAFKLKLESKGGEGGTCATAADCDGSLVCRIPLGETRMQCAKPVCSDGRDDDADGKTDYPLDPGCATPTDDTEADDCPTGPNCPKCANGMDDDGDGFTDYPADLECSSAGQTTEAACPPELDGVPRITAATTNGAIVATDHNDLAPSCGSNGKDKAFSIVLPKLKSFTADTNGSAFSDPTLSLWNAACAGMNLVCNDDSGDGLEALITQPNVLAGTYVLLFDSRSTTTTGTFKINVSGTIAMGDSCEATLGGAFTCEVGSICKGASGAKKCEVAACNDTMDNDADNKTDYPNEPGCASPSDDDETDTCPNGAGCPKCGNGIDDDGDTNIDYPLDTTCASAASDNELCRATEPVAVVTAKNFVGNTATATNDVQLMCVTATGGNDLTYQFDLPNMDSFKVDLGTPAPATANMALELLPSTCGEPAISCTTTNAVTATNLAAGRYFVAVDNEGTTAGAFTATVSGVIKSNSSCESPLFTAGAFTCAAGTTCKGTPGARVCTPAQCNDGVDNDGDGKMDFPAEPGCTSSSDDDETDTCPGAGCPACSNGIDDDSDGRMDYPTDGACVSASGNSEVNCSIEADPIIKVALPMYTGTTVGAANNMAPSCNTANTAPEVTYELNLTVPLVSLTVDTIGTTLDTVLSVRNEACGIPDYDCDDEGGVDFGESKITLVDVMPGAYEINVDGYNANSGVYVLNIKGQVAAGAACVGPLFTSGVLGCQAGTLCTAGTCQ